MRMTAALFSSVALTLGLGVAAIAAPQGMAPYPGQGAAAAPPPPPGDNGMAPQPGAEAPRKRPTCVWTRRIDGWNPVDDYTMVVTQGTKKYLVTFSGKCRAQKHENAMRISRHRSMCLSPGDTVDFTNPFGYTPMHYGSCMISKVEIAPDRTAQR